VAGETVTISAVVFNTGNKNASDVNVSFFDGNTTHGTYLDSLLINLSAGSNATLNTTWLAERGSHNFHVLADPPYGTGQYNEPNETNNLANKTAIVGIWHTFYGSFTGFFVLDSSINESFLNWTANQTANIYATETGSSIDWLNLQALGRNASGGVSVKDFEEADTALNTTGFPDSMNASYTRNGQPVQTKSLELYSRTVNNVPLINSTNTSSFQTGVLWDESDGGLEYNSSQDLVFVTQINPNHQGRYGTYDYEIRFPSTLSTYKLGAQTVSLFVELK
jgi:hypothetical protein